jgi:hypothetical protein
MPTPSIDLTSVEPSSGGAILTLWLAPPEQGQMRLAQVNLSARFKSTGPDPVVIKSIVLFVPGSGSDSASFPVSIPLNPDESASWTQPNDYLCSFGPNPSLTIRLSFERLRSVVEITRPVAVHANPTPTGGYRFWGEVADLRLDEFWRVHATDHGQTNPAQLFAFDVLVAARDPNSNDKYTPLLPGTNGSRNEHHRIWGKPTYAVADGTVVDFRNDFPTNQVPGHVDQAAHEYWRGGSAQDGNGNFFTIATGDEIVLYAHLQAGSLNPRLLSKGASVKAGEFLGLVGNSGASGGPHIHIHANKAPATGKSWVGSPRPMRFHHAHQLAWTGFFGNVAARNWVKLKDRGFAPAYCAVWPSDDTPVARRAAHLAHVAIGNDGQLWAIEGNSAVRTMKRLMPVRSAYLDVNPQGNGLDIVAHKGRPYVVGMNRRVFRGETSGWTQIAGSPECIRLTIDGIDGSLWAIAADNRIFHYTGRPPRWIEHPGTGRAKDICAAQGKPYVIGMNDRVFKSAGSQWEALPGDMQAERIAINPSDGRLWIVAKDNSIQSCSGNGQWQLYAGVPGVNVNLGPSDLVVFQGNPYIIGPDLDVWVGSCGWGWSKLNVTVPA